MSTSCPLYWSAENLMECKKWFPSLPPFLLHFLESPAALWLQLARTVRRFRAKKVMCYWTKIITMTLCYCMSCQQQPCLTPSPFHPEMEKPLVGPPILPVHFERLLFLSSCQFKRPFSFSPLHHSYFPFIRVTACYVGKPVHSNMALLMLLSIIFLRHTLSLYPW